MQLNCPNWITTAPGSPCQVGQQIAGCSRQGRQVPSPGADPQAAEGEEEEERWRGDGSRTAAPPEPRSLYLAPLPCSHPGHFLQRNPSQAQLKEQRGYRAPARTRSRINPSNNRSPLRFRRLPRVSAPGHRPAHSSPRGRGELGPHHVKAPHTLGMEWSPKIVRLPPRKETSEKKGAKVFMKGEPDGLHVEFFSRLKHLGTPATRRRFAKPWLKGK